MFQINKQKQKKIQKSKNIPQKHKGENQAKKKITKVQTRQNETKSAPKYQ